jgi:hypothetical protein
MFFHNDLPDPSTLGVPRIGCGFGSTWDPPGIRSKLQDGSKIAKTDHKNEPTVARSLAEPLDIEVAFDTDRNHE